MNELNFSKAGEEPRVSVVIPVYNGGAYLDRCLEALQASSYPVAECILVDDASTDGATETVVQRYPVRLVKLEQQCGPAFARNWGVYHSSGEIIFFVDADVVLQPDTISTAIGAFLQDESIDAVFGSYDDLPGDRAFLSQYRNLVHHWVHQNGATEAQSFWAGCGAIRREVFVSIGGFDRDAMRIEDIELGHRLHQAGYKIHLLKDMLCKHLKIWSLFSILKTDMWSRAVPWVALMQREGEAFDNLNVNAASKFATALTGLLVLSLLGLVLAGRWVAVVPFLVLIILCIPGAYLGERGDSHRWRSYLSIALTVAGTLSALLWAADTQVQLLLALLPLMLCALIVASQWPFFRFLNAIRGSGYLLAAIPMQLVFFIICGLSVPLGIAQSRVRFMQEKLDPGRLPENADRLFVRDA